MIRNNFLFIKIFIILQSNPLRRATTIRQPFPNFPIHFCRLHHLDGFSWGCEGLWILILIWGRVIVGGRALCVAFSFKFVVLKSFFL